MGALPLWARTALRVVLSVGVVQLPAPGPSVFWKPLKATCPSGGSHTGAGIRMTAVVVTKHPCDPSRSGSHPGAVWAAEFHYWPS